MNKRLGLLVVYAVAICSGVGAQNSTPTDQTGGPSATSRRQSDVSITPPHTVFSPAPEYSSEAREAKFEGTCTLGLIVGTDGRPGAIHVITSLGKGLDEKAIEAVRKWRFQPAMKDGKPVRAVIAVQVEFHLSKK